MTAPLTYLKVLFLVSASTLLVACHSSSSNSTFTPDINTFHIYTSDQTIYSFNEKTAQPTQRGKFDFGENKFLELNLDESKPGYEYAIYVYENNIYLFNYDKESNGQTIKLAELSEDETICGLIPTKTASNASFTDKVRTNRGTLDLPIISIEYQAPLLDCDLATNNRDTLIFESVIKDPSDTAGIIKKSGKSENFIGGLIIDYASVGTSILDGSALSKGSIGFLGQDLQGDKIIFNYSVDGTLDDWSSVFMPNSGIQTIEQASTNQVLVQNDEQIFVLHTANLFTINKASTGIPTQNKIDAMFSKPSRSLISASPVDINQHQNTDTFLIKHDNTLHYYEDGQFFQIPSNENQLPDSPTKVAFDLTSDNTALFVQEENGIQTLLSVSTTSGLATTITQAQEIDIKVIGNTLYVNTLDSLDGFGWQAHRYTKVNQVYTPKTYDNSRFVFMKNTHEMSDSIYLLSSNSNNAENPMIKPALYKFDSSQQNGRKKGNNTNNLSVDFSFGQLNTDVSDIISSEIINDIYGKIVLKGTNAETGMEEEVEEYYYFDPSQTLAEPSISEQSLLLMSRKVL